MAVRQFLNNLLTHKPANESDAILARMTRLHPKVIDLSLVRILRLLKKMAHPERRLAPVIHVAGTNGKGSTVAFIRAMLEAAGYRAHVYSSPHLQRFHERIRIAGQLISERELCARLLECERVNAGEPITFFEITTVAALLAFAETRADVVLLEVGLGGRLDTTNVIARPAVTAITPVDLDHQQFLGDTLDKIAFEKAGILKQGVAAVIGPQKPEARQVIVDQAEKIGAPLLLYGQDWMCSAEAGRMVYQYSDGLLDLPLPALAGRHQLANAGAAIACVQALPGFRVDERAIAAGLTGVEWPARLQRISGGPLPARLPLLSELWLDGGHNPAAAVALAGAIGEMEERQPRPLYLICGMLESKDPRGFLAAFHGLARHVYTLAIPGEANSFTAGALAGIARDAGFEPHPADTLAQALDSIAAMPGAPPRVVICGSLYLAGHVLNLCGV